MKSIDSRLSVTSDNKCKTTLIYDANKKWKYENMELKIFAIFAIVLFLLSNFAVVPGLGKGLISTINNEASEEADLRVKIDEGTGILGLIIGKVSATIENTGNTPIDNVSVTLRSSFLPFAKFLLFLTIASLIYYVLKDTDTDKIDRIGEYFHGRDYNESFCISTLKPSESKSFRFNKLFGYGTFVLSATVYIDGIEHDRCSEDGILLSPFKSMAYEQPGL